MQIHGKRAKKKGGELAGHYRHSWSSDLATYSGVDLAIN